MSSVIPNYHDTIPELAAQLAERGSLGLVLLDASSLGQIEVQYGGAAFDLVRDRVLKALAEQRGKDYRVGDILTLTEPGGLSFLLFLDRKRRRSLPVTTADLRAARMRLQGALIPSLARAAFPYLKSLPKIHLGHGLTMQNPLLGAQRLLDRARAEAEAVAHQERAAEGHQTLEKLQDLIALERIVTAYQPILRMDNRAVLAFEALSRGARGTGLETADQLFGAATDHNLLMELDRLCRQRAFLCSGRVPSNAKLFVNTLPATIRDPQFRGKPLIDFLQKAQVAPDRIVIEITEKLVIENYALFQETMAYFTDLGMNFAVDDVGAGYSGLEAIARLRPAYLKIDMALVRDVHVSLVNREMVKAIISLGHGIGAAVIAEGIQTEEEMAALQAMGVDYGQGYYLARPELPLEQ